MAPLILNRLSKGRQILYSMLLVLTASGICFTLENVIDYKITAFVLLLTVSALAVLFDIVPVMLAAVLSALPWNFFFIQPKYNFHTGSLEDRVLFSMYL